MYNLIKFCFLLIFLLFPTVNNWGKSIKVSLYNSRQVQSVVVSAYNGALTVTLDESVFYVIADGQAIYAALRDEKIWMSDEKGVLGSFDNIKVQGDSLAIVRLRPVLPQLEARNYEGTILISADVDRISLINQIDEERYLAGVVEAENGQGHTLEFYKAKSIICRTYTYGNLDKHKNENFNLCDEVHCQVYKGQCQSRDLIQTAVYATKNTIIVDNKDFKPILATFHSNCGGETESAKNVWHNNEPYLIPITDPHCTSSRNARWDKTISLDDWVAYLVRNGYKPKPNVPANYSFQQTRRTPNYKVDNFTIPVRKIRNDWQLRSTFFSISVENDKVLFRGRGYGHGVGLCQEGAMQMGRKGFKYDEIINFYYKNVELLVVSE